MKIKQSKSIWISCKAVKKSSFLFWWNFELFSRYSVSSVNICLRSSLLAFFSPYFKIIERFSFECRKTKTKVITLTNHNSRKQSMNQSELEANTCRPCQARLNACEYITIGFGFTSDWSRKWREIFNQSQSVAMQNQSNCGITFDTQLKSALKQD